MAQHVGMNQEIEARALPNAFNQPINSIRREWTVALSDKDVLRVRKLPLQLPQRPDFVAAERVNARFSILCPPDM
jgi:hypothetical protein